MKRMLALHGFTCCSRLTRARDPRRCHMEQEHLYIGIRRHGSWRVWPVSDLTERELEGVNIQRDVQCTWVHGLDPAAALREVALQSERGVAPFSALKHAEHGLHLLCKYAAQGSTAVQHAADQTQNRREVPRRPAQSERDRTDEHLRIERGQVDAAVAQELRAFDVAVRKSREREGALHVLERSADAVRVSGVHLGRIPSTAERLLRDWRSRSTARRTHHAARLAQQRTDTDESLLRERARFDETLSTRDEVLALAGHELRNMVAASVGFAGLIEGVAREKHYDDLRTSAQHIQRAGARMQRLVGDLVDAARVAAGGLEVKRELGDLTKVVSEAVDAFHARASERDVSLTLDLVRPLPLVQLDAARVLQVLVNLLSNALKFTPVGGSVVVRVEEVDCEVRCAVIDSGPGVPADMLEAIFERFQQVVQGDRRGLGLGLYIAKYIVQAHGGQIRAQSEVGSGTTVSLTLPTANPTRASALASTH